MTTIMLQNVDPKNIHQQILQLEHIQHDMLPDDSAEANTVANTLKLLHQIEEELRHKARVEHHH
jgi:hypothetical protein